jgi:hypothetical protein
MEFGTERLKDAIEAGNYNAIIPLLRMSIRNNTSLTQIEIERYSKHINGLHRSLLDKTTFRTFKDELR